MGILKKKRNQNLKTYPSDNFQLLQPWSVPILKTVLPRNVFDSMYELSENVLLNPNSESCGHLLAGEIKTEIDIDLTLLNSYDVNTFFKNILTQFILKCKTQMTVDSTVMNNNYDVNIISMWIVSQKPGEYNPVHYHPYCKVSGVMYLKIPDILPSIKNHKDTDGSILFINTTGTGDLELSCSILKCEPKVGDLYIFGSNQHHLVYPYRSKDPNAERRSISFNANFTEML